MRARIKKFFSLCLPFCATFALVVFVFPHATRALEIQYPNAVPGFGNANDILRSDNVTFGQIFQFVFTLALWLIGFLALGSLLISGFIYEISGANPAKKLAAKIGFQSTLIGVAIILGFTIILRAINPELAVLENLTFTPRCGDHNKPCSSLSVSAPLTSAELTYTIDFKNTSIVPSNTSATSVTPSSPDYKLAFEEVPVFQNLPSGSDTDPFTKEFFLAHIDDVVAWAQSNNMNPVFAVAVWLEGTELTQGKNPFGCTTEDTMDPSKQTMDLQPSETCFLGYINKYGDILGTPSFPRWISQYCRIWASNNNGICSNPSYAGFMTGLQENYDAFFKNTDPNRSQKLDPPQKENLAG